MFNYPKQFCSKFQTTSSHFIKVLLVASILAAGTIGYVSEQYNFDSPMKLIGAMVGDDTSEPTLDDAIAYPFRHGHGCCG